MSAPDLPHVTHEIDGEPAPASSGQTIDCFEPATGRRYAVIADGDAEDVNRAVAAAERAFPAWSRLPARERARHLRALAAGIEARLTEFARAESIDTGKPISVASTVDIPRAAQNFEFFADAATQFSSESHATDVTALNYTLRQPLGVVACISPWNLPLYLLTWKIAPALAAGNCVVAKPSEVTPMTAHLLAQLCRDVGLPKGVLNIVHGLGPKVGPALVTHPKVAAVSFTGSTRVGEEIARTAGPLFKKLSLELGGKNATIVFADADFDEAVAGAARAAFSNQGQICLCGSRIYVQRPIYERFRDALVARVRQLRQGDPLEPSTEQGALVSRAHFDKVTAALETARSEGATLLCGGGRPTLPERCAEGWFLAPTLLEGLSHESRTVQEEIFGPVATLAPFDDEAEVVALANGTPYGLAGSIWTNDMKRAHRVAAEIRSGLLWINCWMLRDLRTPFGGTKASGVGREGGLEAMRFFTEPKNVCVKL
jgi:aminomuconate-semialdehyde/2-hydroxymuconate-6-semialdehyde dehydrogenase